MLPQQINISENIENKKGQSNQATPSASMETVVALAPCPWLPGTAPNMTSQTQSRRICKSMQDMYSDYQSASYSNMPWLGWLMRCTNYNTIRTQGTQGMGSNPKGTTNPCCRAQRHKETGQKITFYWDTSVHPPRFRTTTEHGSAGTEYESPHCLLYTPYQAGS